MTAHDGNRSKEKGRMTPVWFLSSQLPSSLSQKCANRHNNGQSPDCRENDEQEKVCVFSSLTSCNEKKTFMLLCVYSGIKSNKKKCPPGAPYKFVF